MRTSGLLLCLALALAACGPADSTPPSAARSAVTAEERSAPDQPRPDGPPFLGTNGLDVLVQDAEGRPIADARVSHPRSTAWTDVKGRARLGAMGFDLGMPGNDRYWKTVTVQAKGYVPVARAHAWDRNGLVHFRLVERGLPVRGCVVDDDGHSLGGIPLELRADGIPSIHMTTDERGAFATEEAAPTPATLRVSGTRTFADPVSVVPPQEDVKLVAWPVCVVRGVLTPAAGTSMPEDLVVQADGHASTAYVHAGKFTLWCRPGPVTLRVNGRVCAQLKAVAGETLEDVTIELGPWAHAKGLQPTEAR